MWAYIYTYCSTIQKINDFQNSHCPPIIIQHSVAIRHMCVYMYAHICSIYFWKPPCGKQQYLEHIWAYMYTYLSNIQKIIDFQNSHGPPLIIQHSVAIEHKYVYMYAHICSNYFCQPPSGKQKEIKHMLAYIYTYLSDIQKILDFQNSHGPPIIIQCVVAIENMYVYMNAHICSIYFCQPPCGKQK